MPSSFYAYRSICNALGASLVQILDFDEIGAAGDTCMRTCGNDDLVASPCQVRCMRHCDCGAKDVVDTLELFGDHRDDAEVQCKAALDQVAWRESKDGSARAAARAIASGVSDADTASWASTVAQYILLRSVASMMRPIISTVSTGNLPTAVSLLSMTASVPSKMALATSVTSARVGDGFSTMELSI